MNPTLTAGTRPLFAPGGSVNVVSFLVGGFDAGAGAWVRQHAEVAARRVPPGVGVHVRDTSDPAFGEWVGDLVRSTFPADAPAPGPSTAWVEIAGHTEDRADHGTLGAAWQAVRLLLREAGAGGMVWDGLAFGWRSAAQVLALPPGDLQLAASWRCDTIDGFVDESGAPFVCLHSLGLAKFGRPDLLAFGSARHRDLLEGLVSGLGHDLACGAVLRPGDVIEKGGLCAQLLEYRPGETAPPLDVPFFAPPLVVVPQQA